MADHKRRCFIIGPMRDEMDENNLHWLQRLDRQIIEPLLRELGFNYVVTTPYDIPDGGQIINALISEIDRSDIIIADITGLGANVFYEIAVGQALGKPVITVGKDGPPFDLLGFRHVFLLPNTPPDQIPADVRSDLIRCLKFANNIISEGDIPENPITLFFGVPLTGVSATTTVADTYFRNFIEEAVQSFTFLNHENDEYLYNASIFTRDASGTRLLQEIGKTRKDRDGLKLTVVIPNALEYCDPESIRRLRGPEKLRLKEATISGKHRNYTTSVRLDSKGRAVEFIDVPTAMRGLSKTVERRIRGLRVKVNSPEWTMLEQEEIDRFADALTRFVENSPTAIRSRVNIERFDPAMLALSREDAGRQAPRQLWLYDILKKF